MWSKDIKQMLKWAGERGGGWSGPGQGGGGGPKYLASEKLKPNDSCIDGGDCVYNANSLKCASVDLSTNQPNESASASSRRFIAVQRELLCHNWFM